MKVLIVRFSSIGDIVLTTPVIRVLKKQLQANVHYATKPAFRSILESNPYIDKLHLLSGSLSGLADELRKEKFDLIIDLHHNLRTRILKFKLGVKAYSFDKLNIEKWLLVNFKINRMPVIHIVNRYLATVLPLGIKDDGGGLDFFVPGSDEIPAHHLPATHQNGFVAYAIGGQHATKKLPVERMIELCRKINQPIVLLGGKEDVEKGEEVAAFFRNNITEEISIYNACGLWTLNQSASLLKQATVVFSHDTGLMHIAAALKKEVFSIWGNTVPAFGMYPYRTESTIIENKNLSCRPCSKIGYKKCPQGHFRCMKEVEFDFPAPGKQIFSKL